MNRFTQFLVSSIVVLGITGCSKSEMYASSINSIDEIKMQVLTAINRALDNRKDTTNQSIPVKNDSDTCSIEVPDNFQENKTVHIICYDTKISVTALLPRNGFGTIKNALFDGKKIIPRSECIIWNIHSKDGETLQNNTCATRIST